MPSNSTLKRERLFDITSSEVFEIINQLAQQFHSLFFFEAFDNQPTPAPPDQEESESVSEDSDYTHDSVSLPSSSSATSLETLYTEPKISANIGIPKERPETSTLLTLDTGSSFRNLDPPVPATIIGLEVGPLSPPIVLKALGPPEPSENELPSSARNHSLDKRLPISKPASLGTAMNTVTTTSTRSLPHITPMDFLPHICINPVDNIELLEACSHVHPRYGRLPSPRRVPQYEFVLPPPTPRPHIPPMFNTREFTRRSPSTLLHSPHPRLRTLNDPLYFQRLATGNNIRIRFYNGEKMGHLSNTGTNTLSRRQSNKQDRVRRHILTRPMIRILSYEGYVNWENVEIQEDKVVSVCWEGRKSSQLRHRTL